MNDGDRVEPKEIAEPPGCEIMRHFLAHSPYVKHLGYGLESIEADRAVLAMPFAETLVTVGSTLHGGALASLIDSAATAAAWSGAEPPQSGRSSTVGMSVNYLAPANGQAVTAEAHVLRRGRSLVHCDVDVRTADGVAVAKGVVVYKIG
jgi:uncharacterized protein (TIGR00369 family)